MQLQGLPAGRKDRGCQSTARPALLGVLLIGALVVIVATPASASTAQGTGGGSVGGFGWSFMIPATVIGLVVLGALLATRVGRSSGPDPVADDTEPAEDDSERTHEDPPA